MNENFLKELSICLTSNGFSTMKVNFNENIDINIFANISGNIGYVITPTILEKKDYYLHLDILKKTQEIFLSKYNVYKIFYMEILISDSFNEDSLTYLDKEVNIEDKLVNIIWGVDTKAKKIVIKNNQPTKFLNIENYILDVLYDRKNSSKNNNLIYNNSPKIKSKNCYFTYSLIILILLIHFIILFTPQIEKKDIIYSYGISPSMLKNREYYRLISFLFLHSNITHLLSNTLSIYIFGSRIEKYFGKISFAILFIIGGIFSGLSSYIFTKSYSIGASGAIFALEGALLYFTLKTKLRLDGLDFYIMSALAIIGIFGNFTDKTIDNAGHIGGFIIGLIISYIYCKKYIKTCS